MKSPSPRSLHKGSKTAFANDGQIDWKNERKLGRFEVKTCKSSYQGSWLRHPTSLIKIDQDYEVSIVCDNLVPEFESI